MEHVKQFPSQDVRRKLARMCWQEMEIPQKLLCITRFPSIAGEKHSGI
jgi:hypothetical protein